MYFYNEIFAIIRAKTRTISNVLYVAFCVGRSKASTGKYILYCPATRAISRYFPAIQGNILPRKVVPLIHTFNLCKRNFQLYIHKHTHTHTHTYIYIQNFACNK